MVAEILVLGAGLGGLSTAMLLARGGHQVTVLERDPAEPPPAAQAWEAWERRGINQFRLPHLMLPRWRAQMEQELPEVLDELTAVGGLRLNMLAMLPETRRGPLRDGDERFETVTARRPVLEAAVAAVAGRTPGVTIRRGVAATGLLADQGQGTQPPHVRGVLTEGGRTVRADLVVDCGGRRSALGSWLEAVGARRPAEEREDCGFVYYARHFRTTTGELPAARANVLQHYDSVSLLTLPSDNGTWSVVFTTSSRDPALRALRDPSRWDAALARYPMVAHWGEGEPITGVDAIAGIEDRHRRLVVDDRPVATGVVAVGDAWACTNPSLGRGAAIGLLHACCLRDVLRDVDPGDPEKLARRFDEVTTTVVEPLYRMTVGFDRHRLAEIAADVDGTPYVTDDPRWLVGKATFAASLTDPDITRAYGSLAALLVTPDELFATPGLVDRVLRLAAGAPSYPLQGPTRQELLATIAD
jgi:2-polyprenyl-6-methoxyphenol hydroxylase-like FAD-dependent oxidoreductase